MSKIKTGSNATFTSAGKGLNVIGDHCYAYSGVITTSTSYQTALEFNTGKEYIKAILQLTADLDELSTSWYDYQLSINDIVIAYSQMERNNFDWEPLDFIIPPLSTVKLEVKVQGNTPDTTAVLVGKVYG